MINAKYSGFVSDVLTAIQQSLVNAIKEGDYVGSILRVGFWVICLIDSSALFCYCLLLE